MYRVMYARQLQYKRIKKITSITMFMFSFG